MSLGVAHDRHGAGRVARRANRQQRLTTILFVTGIFLGLVGFSLSIVGVSGVYAAGFIGGPLLGFGLATIVVWRRERREWRSG